MSDRTFIAVVKAFTVFGVLAIAVFALTVVKKREAFEIECTAMGGEYVNVRGAVPKLDGSEPLCFAPGVLLHPKP